MDTIFLSSAVKWGELHATSALSQEKQPPVHAV
jgi:hypothetical protein